MKIVLAVNVDWFLLSHRLPIALRAKDEGHDVHIITTVIDDGERLESFGFTVHHLEMDRSSFGALGILRVFWGFWRIFKSVKPDVAHLVTIKPVLVGGLAARFSPVKGVVYAISGLGHVFVDEGPVGRLRKALVSAWYRCVLKKRNMRIIFQNPDDRHAIESVARLMPDKVVMIPGSGVDLSEYQYMAIPPGEAVIMMAARLLSTKGVREYVAAARILKSAGVPVRFWLVGSPDLHNPASIQPEELAVWEKEGNVELLGHRSDIPSLMAQAHMVVLPSYYGEGLPKVLIEAAACGRAVVTTDMPGCRDAIEPDVTGLLVPPRNAQVLAEVIKGLIENRETCEALGLAGRRRAEEVFDINAVVQTHLNIYQALGEAK